MQKRSCPLNALLFVLVCFSCTQWVLCPAVCLHWEIKVFQVILSALGYEPQDLGAPEMHCFLKFLYFS